MKTRFAVGESVKMSDDAVENYGEKWRDRELTIEEISSKYMPATEFFAKGRPSGYHPGFDASTGCALYELADASGERLPMALYDWELTQ